MGIFKDLGIDTVQELAQLFLTVALGVLVGLLVIRGDVPGDFVAGSFSTILGFWFRGKAKG